MKKKKGMSIAAVLGIMVCLVSTVTTCFILAIRSSILTSRSLKYIESYNDASSSIDNSISFMSDEINLMYKKGSISGDFFVSLCETSEGLFGVETTTTITSTQTDLDMKAGVTITIKKQYTKINQTKDYLMSVVKFAATMSEGSSIITNELAFDKTSEVKVKEDLLKVKYNSTNLLWNYWCEQAYATEDGIYNTLVGPTSKGSSLYSYFYQNEYKQLLDRVSDIDIVNIIDGKYTYDGKTDGNLSTTSFVERITNSARNNSDIQYYGASNGINTFYGTRTDDWAKYNNYDIVHNSNFNKGKDSLGRDIVVIDRNVRMDGSHSWIGSKGASLYITNNSVMFLGGSFTTDANVYVERGSSLIVCGDFTIQEYECDGAKYAPILDADYETNSTKSEEAKGKYYVGGGVIVQGNFDYSALNSDGVLLTDNSRYNYNTKTSSASKACVNGAYTVTGKVNLLFNNKDNNRDTKLPVGATIYCDGEASLSNIAFMSTSEKVRPFLLFCDASISIKYCCSLVDGKTVKYINENTWNSVENKKCGFAIITCTKLKDLVGCTDIVFMNMFYNNNSEMNKDQENTLLQASKDMQGGAAAYVKYGVYNGFVNENALASCSDHIEADSIHWYIPSKLRGSMIAGSISASESRK